ncbi:hypothetical protein Droror1_Dr00023625 [Drosera rotundifolia]
MKRILQAEEGMDLDQRIAMANYLILLSRDIPQFPSSISYDNTSAHGRVFECKTCNRQFQSFQALGGHRASHKKPKLGVATEGDHESSDENHSAAKAKTHECSICGTEFAIGQALGGHMRRHRTYMYGHDRSTSSVSLSGSSMQAPVVKKPSSGNGRVLCLDLNLTPLENELHDVGKIASIFG